MSLKKTDLTRLLETKLEGQRKGVAPPGRYAQGPAEPGRKERRKADAAAGLVPFACKLPAELAQQLRDRATAEGGDLNGTVAELLRKALA